MGLAYERQGSVYFEVREYADFGKLSRLPYAAQLEIAIEDLPPAEKLGWPGQQYVLWAVDTDQRILNLGPVPLRGQGAKWKVQIPSRAFGLLVTAEKNPKAEAPSTAVVLESLLPTDPFLVVPVLRLDVSLVPPNS